MIEMLSMWSFNDPQIKNENLFRNRINKIQYLKRKIVRDFIYQNTSNSKTRNRGYQYVSHMHK